MSESTQNLPWRTFTAGGVGQTIEDSEGRSVCFGFGDRPELAEFIVSACNTRDELLAACKAALEALASCYDVTEWPADGTSRQAKALAVLTAAIAAAEGGE